MEHTTEGDVASVLARMRELEPHINAMVHIDAAEAHAPDREDGLAGSAGPLSGRVVVVKDNIAVLGAPWACGSATRRGEPPASRDAEVVHRLRAAGAIILGTTNLDEFAMGASTESSAWGATHNPIRLDRSPGGSSGGSAAAVAAYGVLALGTDSGGSIREPASQCGVVGMKPSSGAIPVDGVVPFAPSLDTVGPLARTVAETALLHDVAAGTDRAMLMSSAAAHGAQMARLDGWTIGVVTQMSGSRNAPEVIERFERATALLHVLGAGLVEASLPRTGQALRTYFELSSVEALLVLESHVRLGDLGPEAMHRLEQGRALIGTQVWDDAQVAREQITLDLDECFARCDLLISPTIPLVAPPLGRAGLDDPLAIPRTDWWTVEANLAGIPAMSLPSGLDLVTGLPVGLQLMAPRGRDALIYEAAAALEAGGVGRQT